MEYETSADLRSATEKLDNRDFKGQSVRCIADVSYLKLPLLLTESLLLRYRRNVPVTGTDHGPLHHHVADILRVPTAITITIAVDLVTIALAVKTIVDVHHLCGITTIGIGTAALRHVVVVLQWTTMVRHEVDMLMMDMNPDRYHLVAVMILTRTLIAMEGLMTAHHLLVGCVVLGPVADMMEAMIAVLTGDYLSLLLNLFFPFVDCQSQLLTIPDEKYGLWAGIFEFVYGTVKIDGNRHIGKRIGKCCEVNHWLQRKDLKDLKDILSNVTVIRKDMWICCYYTHLLRADLSKL